jgi:PAS domain S-box-containing protein
MELRLLAEDGWKALLQALFEHAPAALFVLDAAGRVFDLNRRASEALGRTREELIGRCPGEFDVNWRQAFPPGSEASLAGSPVSFQTKHKRKDGTVFPVHACVVPLGHDGDRMSLVFAQDLSERESTQSALQACEERFRALVEQSFDVDEQRLLREIGGLTGARTGVMVFRRLAESERRLEAAQRLAAVGWWERDFLTGHVSLSDESRRIFGVPAVDLPYWQDRWVGLIHPDDRACTAEASAAALAGGPRYDVEYRIIRPDGTMRVVHSQGDVTWDESGRPLRQFGVMQDITELWQASAERKRVEVELRARQELLDLAQKAARAVAFDLNIGTRDSQNPWSPELEAMFGLEPGTYDGSYQGWKQLIHPDDWPIVKAAIERANASGELTAEYRVVHKDGSVHWLRARGRMFFDAGGEPERIVGFMFDVTDWFQAMEALRASEDSFRTVFDRAIDAFFLLDKDLNIIDVNREACESLGRNREELIGMHPRDFDVDMDQPRLRQLEQRRGPDEPLTFETRHRRKDGTVLPVEIRVGSFRRGGQRCYLALARDITERKRADEELRASETRFRTFVDRATDAFFLLDEHVIIVDVNRQACESLGYSREELVGMHPRQFDAGLTDAAIDLVTARARAGETATFETFHRRRDGTEFPVEIRAGTFRRGEQLLYIALARDTSERKLAEETVRAKDQALQAARELVHLVGDGGREFPHRHHPRHARQKMWMQAILR